MFHSSLISDVGKFLSVKAPFLASQQKQWLDMIVRLTIGSGHLAIRFYFSTYLVLLLKISWKFNYMDYDVENNLNDANYCVWLELV